MAKLILITGPHCAQCPKQRERITALVAEDDIKARIDAGTLTSAEIDALSGPGRKLMNQLAVMAVPTTVLIDNAGQVSAYGVGILSRMLMREWIARL